MSSETVESATWFPKVYRKDYKIGLNLTGLGVDDPDAQFYENYACGSDRNYTGYCNPANRQAVRSAIDGAGSGKAPQPRLGNR